MHRHIETALENLSASSKQKQDRIKAILKKYLNGEINVDEAYYELLDDELIPMPQRCNISAKIPETEQDELRLREKIKEIIS